MRAVRVAACLLFTSLFVFAAKKVISPDTSASNEQIDLEATITLDPSQVTQQIGADPGQGIVLLKVKITPKVDTPVQVSPDDFILLSHDDGERAHPFDPAQIAGKGALVENTKEGGSQKKSSGMAGLGGMVAMGGGGSGSPGNSKPVTVNTTMDDKRAGNNALLEALKAKQLPYKATTQPVEGYLYFPLDGKHKLKNLAVLYRGPAGKLDLEFVH